MPSPFPGMDPYLERPGLWSDVHAGMITVIRDQLQMQITPRYIALITPYIAFESIEISPIRMAIPDVGIYERDDAFATQSSAATVADAPLLTAAAVMEIPTTYGRVEVRTVGDETLVTAIEVLSPANKRPGPEGADAYEKKRQELFRSEAHLLEIDLLRGGQRPQIAPSTQLPNMPYFIFLSRVQRRPRIDIWPCSLRTALPNVPVPLRYPDRDAVLNLTEILQQIYRNARYDLQVDYHSAPPPPALDPEDAAWADSQLRERGLRE